jgi:CDP-glucose 4,6-dehydratase
MKVLVTGHTGFKGSWLTLVLTQAGHDVSGIALDPLPNGIFEKARVGNLLTKEFRADIRDGALVTNLVQEIQPELVFHLAAQPLVRESYEHPRETLDTNIWGTLNLIDACLAIESVKRLVVVTTDKVYRNIEKTTGYQEDDPLGGDDPYSVSKACADLLTSSWAHSFGRPGLGIATARSGNVIGGGDVSKDRLIPDLLDAFEHGQAAKIRYPNAVRPWQHVLDALSGYLLLANYLVANKDFSSWNFASDETNLATVADVCDMVAGLWGRKASWVTDASTNPHEAGLLLLNAKKAEAVLGWRNKLGVNDAIKWTLDWEKSTKASDARQVSYAQITKYLEM